jgi:hypothetical protein
VVSKGTPRTILLALAGVTVVVVSIYLTRTRQRTSPGGPETVVPEGAVDDAADAGEGVRDPGRPVVRSLRSAVHGVLGDLARVQKRAANERELVAASLKAGKSGRHVARPVGQAPPTN